MTATYTNDPGGNTRDMVRFRLGDTGPLPGGSEPGFILSDEEIDGVVSTYGDALTAASICADTIAAKYARIADQTTGDNQVSFRNTAKHYADLAVTLRRDTRGVRPLPYVGGVSRAERAASVAQSEPDGDRVPPRFSRFTDLPNGDDNGSDELGG